jgi:tRNA A-37 threonylcarbamoyl transferase component Bud32
VKRLAAYGEPVEGTPFGRYRLIALIGEGGMGEVWRAHDTVTDREVAIKLLPPKLSKDEDFQQRFRREAHAAAKLNTPHAVPIYDYGEIDGRLFVSMRLIEGRDLATVVAEGPMEPVRAVRVIEGVALALHAAHQVGLLHRDVKPSNILLDDNDFAYLIDFGIARAADDTRMTKTGNTIGTFAYIAPERLDRQGNEDARVDIYSLACVLYECLTGEPPFSDDTMPRLMMAHLHAPPPRPSIARSDVPVEVDEVIATGMAKDPDQRYATTVELAGAAHDAITGPIGLPARDPATRAAFIPPAAQTVHATEAAGLNLDTPHPGVGVPAETSTPAQKPWWPPRGRSPVIAAIIAAVVVLVAGFVIFRPQQSPRPPAPAAVSTTQPAAPAPPPPPKLVEEAALQELLLSPEQIDVAMGVTGMMVTHGTTNPMEDDSAWVPDNACRPLDGNLEAPSYAGSGLSAWRDQVIEDGPRVWTHHVAQGVVLFPSVQDAGAFFTASTQRWSACANRQFTHSEGGKYTEVWTVGPVSNINGTLSATKTENSPGFSVCQRALTVANNVVIDVSACSVKRSDPPGDAAATIAHQIAAKVPTT